MTITAALCAFDAYGTLFDFNTVHRCEAELGERAPALRELWRSKQLQYFWQRNQLDAYLDFEQVTADALDVALKILGIDRADLKQRLLELYEHYRPYADVVPALQALKAQGLRLVIHTNATVRLVEASLVSSGLRELFDDIISIHEIGRYKPHPAAYQLLLDRAGVEREEVCFVSSNGWDTHGAAAFGLQVAWINRGGLPDDALPGKAALELASLADLPPRVRTARP